MKNLSQQGTPIPLNNQQDNLEDIQASSEEIQDPNLNPTGVIEDPNNEEGNEGGNEPPITDPQNLRDALPSYVTPNYIQALEEQLKEQNRTIQTLANRATETPQPSAPPQPPEDPNVTKQRFYTDPTGETRKIIKQELDAAIAPLRDFVQTFRGQNAYGELKSKFKSNLAYRQMSEQLNDPAIEAAVDQIMSQVQNPNEDHLQQAIIHAVGLKATGILPGASNGNHQGNQPQPQQQQQQIPQNPNPMPTPVPAHVRPSAPPRANPNQRPQRRALTELERRIAREQGLTDEQYLNWLEMPANRVVDADKDGIVK